MKGDRAVEAGADKLDELADKAEARGGVAAKLSGELVEDASFLRKLKPSLMVRRAKGELPRDEEPGSTRHAPPGPQLGPRRQRRGPNPFLVVGAAFAVGTVLAKLIDWRGHAHPRR